MINVPTYILIGRVTDFVLIRKWEDLDNDDARIQASMNICRFPVGSLFPANLSVEPPDTETGYENVDKFCSYSTALGVLSTTPSLLLLVDAYPEIAAHRIADVIFSTVHGIAPQRVVEQKKMHISSANMQTWYPVLSNAERIAYKRVDFNEKSSVNAMDNEVKGILQKPIDDILAEYFTSKFSKAQLGSMNAIPEKVLNLSDREAVDKEFPKTTEIRDIGYERVDRFMERKAQMEQQARGDEEPPDVNKSKIEIASH